MMNLALETLQLENFRIIQRAELELAPRMNLFHGQNGAGKTSVLEAIDFLSRGRSFRTHRWDELLRKESSSVMVAADIRIGDEKQRLGINRSAASTTIRLSGRDVGARDSAALLPVSSLHPESQELVLGPPSLRRSYLDFGLFHVEPEFYEIWRRYQRALTQRNAALRRGGRDASLWNEPLAEAGQKLNALRISYVEALLPTITEVAARLLGSTALQLAYKSGWNGSDLLNVLVDAESQDRMKGYTSVGPHRADLDIRIRNIPASQIVSRGQLKLLICTLVIAQLKHLQSRADVHAVLLLDELPAELDEHSRRRLLKDISALNVQTFVTAIEPENIPIDGWSGFAAFHVEQGQIQPML